MRTIKVKITKNNIKIKIKSQHKETVEFKHKLDGNQPVDAKAIEYAFTLINILSKENNH